MGRQDAGSPEPTGDESDVEVLIEVIVGLKRDDRQLTKLLIPRSDSELIYIFEHGTERGAELASTILAVRNPDRDPAYLATRFPAVLDVASQVGTWSTSRMGFFGADDSPLMLFNCGFARLRQLDPVGICTRLLDDKSSTLIRPLAASVLGETSDLLALHPLADALRDPHRGVRRSAADSVRRLRHAGAGAVLAGHPVRPRLVECLHDRWGSVRVAAARALGSMNDVGPLYEAKARTPFWRWGRRHELNTVLNGVIPPLHKTWPGDETT